MMMGKRKPSKELAARFLRGDRNVTLREVESAADQERFRNGMACVIRWFRANDALIQGIAVIGLLLFFIIYH